MTQLRDSRGRFVSDGIVIDGVDQTIRNFENLPRDMMIEAKEKLLRKAAQPVLNLAKAYSVRYMETGMFQESIGVKLWPDRETRTMFNVVLAIVGSRRDPRWENRSNIAHLLEKGWRVASGGTLERTSGRSAATSKVTGERGQGVGVGFVPGLHMFERAAKTGGPMAMGLIRSELPRICKRVWNRRKRRAH